MKWPWSKSKPLVECAVEDQGRYCWLFEHHKGVHSCRCGAAWRDGEHSMLEHTEHGLGVPVSPVFAAGAVLVGTRGCGCIRRQTLSDGEETTRFCARHSPKDNWADEAREHFQPKVDL